MWESSLLSKSASIEQLFEPLIKIGSIQGATIGEGERPINEGSGDLQGGMVPPKPQEEQESEDKKKIKQVVNQQLKQPTQQLKLSMPNDGWFQIAFGKNADSMVKDLRMIRRERKDMRDDIDLAIKAIRLTKKEEVDITLKSLSWSDTYIDSIRSLGISDRNLRALRKHGVAKEFTLRNICSMWKKGNDVITKLSQVEGDFDKEQLHLWTEANQLRKDARKQWKVALHPIDSLKKNEAMWLTRTADVLSERGPLSSNEIYNSIGSPKNLTIRKMASMLKIHGIEFDIEKIGNNYGIICDDMVIVKDIWAYAAGFLDADGYITITKRGEPRAGFVATGKRGKLHCENLHKSLGCGILQTDLKVHKNSTRSQHRLQFYGADDLRKLMNGLTPHLQMKKTQAHAVLELLNLRGRGSNLVKGRRDELYRIVKWANWKDVPKEREKLLREWKVDEAEVLTWGQRDNEVIRLVDDAHRIEELI
jgi:hypothetical protein